MNLQERYLSYLSELKGIVDLQNVPEFISDVERFTQRLTDKEFRIAVVGEFSSGKSTFINAILGKDILNHEQTETTAVITRIVNVKKNDCRAYTGAVKLRNGNEIKLKDLSSLIEYTTTMSKEYKVVEEIESVNIYIHFMDSKADVVIVDTPGLNGMADGHRELTIDIIKKAHACIYLLQKRGLSESDTEFIRYLLNYQRNFIFVQNFIDELKKYEGETVEKKVAEQEESLNKYVFDNYPEANFRICGISALLKLASEDKSFKRLYKDSSKDLTDDDRSELAKKSNFVAFEEILHDQFADQYLTKLQYGDTAWAIDRWMQELIDHVQIEYDHATETLELSKEQGALLRLESLKIKINENRTRHEGYLKNFIDNKFREIRKTVNAEIENNLEYLNNEIDNEINSCKTIGQLLVKSENLPNELDCRLDTIYEQNKNIIGARILGLYQTILTQVNEYSGINNDELEIKKIYLDVQKNNIAFKPDSSRLETKMESLRKTQEDVRNVEKEIAQRNVRIKIENDAFNEASAEYRNIDAAKKRELNLLGDRPVARTYQEPYTYYRDREGFGSWVTNLVLGQKKCTGYRTIRDDSAGIAWDKKIEEIENRTSPRLIDLMKKQAAAERFLIRLKQEQKNDEDKLCRKVKDIEKLKREIKEEEKTLKMKTEYAKNEHLANEKTKLKENVKKYLVDIVADQIKTIMNDILKNQNKELTDWTIKKYHEAVQKKLEWIEQCKLEKAPELQRKIGNLYKTLEKLKHLVARKEEENARVS